jgi:hypothetical protein
MKTITVATFNRRADAEPVKQRLQDAQIMAEIHEVSAFGRFCFGAEPLAGVHLEVPAKDYKRALDLVHLLDTPEGVMRAALHCPECGSSRIEYPQHTRKFILPNIIGLLSAVGLLERDFYCQDCQHVWPPPGRKPHAPRAHEAPNYFIEGVEEARRAQESRPH